MRKISIYIFLILLVFTSVFRASIIAHADKTTGYCLDGANNLLSDKKDPTACTSANKQNRWISNNDVNKIGGQKGICISETASGSGPTSDTDPASCEANGGRWEGPTPGILRNTDYKLLQPLPCKGGESAGCDANGQLTVFDPTGTSKLGEYLNIMITLFIGLCAVAAVIMIVIGGIQYSTSELIGGKEEAKNRILNAIFGLVLALGSYAILYTINPDLLKTEIDIGGANITSQGEVNVANIKEIMQQIIDPGGPINAKNIRSRGTPCDADTVYRAAQSANRSLTAVQARTLACIGGAESGGCKNVPASVAGVPSTAYGPFQILGSNRSTYGKTDACRSNQNSLACHASMAAGLFRANINRPYIDWLITQAPCANATCIALGDPSVNLHISTPDVYSKGKLVSKGRSDIYNYCGLSRIKK